VDERARDGEHRASVQHGDLRLADQQQQQRHRGTEAHRDVAVVPRRSHPGRIYPKGPAARPIEFNAPIGVSFLIPAFNEAATIGEVLERIDALGLERQIVVVDDGSTDDTAAIVAAYAAEHPQVELVRQANRGKGAAVRAAIPLISQEIAVIQDADMEYDPADVVKLIAPIERGVADVVYGSRLSGGAPQRAYLFWHLVGNRFLSLLTGLLFNTTLSDMETGYKAFRSDVLRSLRLTQDSFAIEPEITGEVCRRHLRIYEMPISYYGRTYAEGKKITWRDGFKAIGVLLSVRLRRR
jgi:glycosyltransferase involved in cell wall biosynthesis